MRFTIIEDKLVPEPLCPPTFPQPKFSPISHLPILPPIPLNTKFTINPEIQNMTLGKQLLLDDLPFPIEELHSHYQNGYITYRKGIEYDRKRPRCVRCGNQDLSWFSEFPCTRCQQLCIYCRRCLMMGRVSACTPLISWSGPNPSPIPVSTPILAWTGTLSPGQQQAATQVSDCIQSKKELLVWAVCGAGKTEILFAGIERALQQNLRVCIATPRTDVVLELTPRLQAAFPTITIASLYGGSPDRHQQAPLTITTTHQLLRFYQAFDVVILDEVDAFPYSVDETLQYAVKQARKPNSALIYLTATPNQKWQKECLNGKRHFVTIPARFHRHRLPVPEFVWCGNWEKRLKRNVLPPNVLKWLTERVRTQKQALLFLPKIKLIASVLPLLQAVHPAIESVHAQDPERKEKVQKMRNGLVPLLITTTILERGVTFPNIDVAVLGAEDQIFTESALVQIAGRVGRSAQFPTGTITFFHYGKTKAMVKARNQIVKMNKQAWQKGLID